MEGTGAIDKAIDVLETIAESKGLTAAEIAAALGIPTPTVYRLVRAWQRRGYVIADEHRRLLVGSKLLRLSSSQSAADLLRNGAGPILERLVADTDVASAQIAVLGTDQVVFIAMKVRPRDSFRIDLNVGSMVPLHSTAVGKAIIAAHSETDLRALVGRLALAPRTESTITDPEVLERDCTAGVERGYWTSIGEHASDLWSVAAGINGLWDGTKAAIGVSEHMWRYSKQRTPALGRAARKAALELEMLIRGDGAQSPDGKTQEREPASAE